MRIVFAAAVLAASTPVLAQSSSSTAAPEDDLRCAAWAAVVAGLNKDNPEIANGFSMALAWFVARYEGATGTPFEQVMTAEYLEGLVPQFEAIEPICTARMQEMGQRFTDWGTKLQAAGR